MTEEATNQGGYLFFLVFDTGKQDEKGRRIMQYHRTTRQFPWEEVPAAIEWLAKELSKEAEQLGSKKVAPMMPPLKLGKVKSGPHLFGNKYEKQNNSIAVQKAGFLSQNMKHDPEINDKIFDVLQKLKQINPGDDYYEAYQWHWQKRRDKFYDHYHLAWQIAKHFPPTRIMEIGTRTGISLGQIISAMKEYGHKIGTVVSFDVFDDGYISPELVGLNFRHLGLGIKPNFQVGNSLETVPKYKTEHPGELFDWVLVDGNHEANHARQDLENVVSLTAAGGLIVFDDISEDGCSLMPVWEDFKAAHKDEFYFYENLNGKGVGVGVKK